MANSNVMPELINNYQIFNDAKRLLGVSGEVELPNLESLTESLEVAGHLGNSKSRQLGSISPLS